jgi:hypothetical protein
MVPLESFRVNSRPTDRSGCIRPAMKTTVRSRTEQENVALDPISRLMQRMEIFACTFLDTSRGRS